MITNTQMMFLEKIKTNDYNIYSYRNDKNGECFLRQTQYGYEYCVYTTITCRSLKKKGLIVDTKDTQVVTVNRSWDLPPKEVCVNVYELGEVSNHMNDNIDITPQQLLEIAQVVESDKNWKLFVSSGNVAVPYKDWDLVYQPHKDTERGQAQLLRVIFAMAPNIPIGSNRIRKPLRKNDTNGILLLAHEMIKEGKLGKDDV